MLLLEKSKYRHCGNILTVASFQSGDVKPIPNCDNRIFQDKEAAWMQRHNPGRSFTILFWVLAFLMTLAVAPTAIFAEDSDDSGGHVLPGPAKPRGYSLSDMAKATAFFNTRPDRTPETEPDTPFQILYVPQDNNLTFEVRPGTMLYVPIFVSDDSLPIVGDFPNVDFRQAVLLYIYSKMELGTIYMRIVVDDTVNSLGSDYVVGVRNVKLGDGPGGTQEPRIGSYIVFAAFLTSLNKGTHKVAIQGYLSGAALGGGVFQFSNPPYKVIVR
jgi:hypothetical protein